MRITGPTKSKQLQYCASSVIPDAKRVLWLYDFNCPGIAFPPPGDTIQFDGRGLKGKQIKFAYKWTTKGSASPIVKKGALPGTRFATPGDTIKINQPRLPMPNLNDVGVELLAQGAFPILVGGQSETDSNVVRLKKYNDALKALAKLDHGQF